MSTVPTLSPGDPAPWFTGRTRSNPRYHLDTVAGRYVLLSFLGSAAEPYAAAALSAVHGPLRSHFNDEHCAWFGISIDPADEAGDRLAHQVPGIRYFFDSDLAISQRYGAIRIEPGGARRYIPFTLVLDPALRILANIPMSDATAHNEQLGAVLAGLAPVNEHAAVALNAPVLIIPRVFEPEFCRELISLYQQHGGISSGFMRQQGEATVALLDDSFKRRRDFVFEAQPEYEALRATIRERMQRRVAPEIRKAFQYEATHIERYIVACYDSTEGGFFRAHRDNTTAATAHRRFACTLNLNAEDYEGGELMFPEFGNRTYRAPTGGAVIFSCSLLHEATPVQGGTRYAFLPFLYDEAGAKVRRANSKFIRDESGFTEALRTQQTGGEG